MTHGIDAGLLLIRVVLGVTVFLHGYNKFFGGGRIPGTARWFASMGMRPNGTIHAVMAATTEVVAGLGFAAGLLTPFDAAGITALMIVAFWTVHRKDGFFIVKGGYEYNLILAVVAIGVSAIGPGTYSLDNALKLTFATSTPKVAVAISVGLGVISGVGLLAACYRPPKPEPEPTSEPASAASGPEPEAPDVAEPSSGL